MKLAHFKILVFCLPWCLVGCPCSKKTPTSPGSPIEPVPTTYDELPKWSPDGQTIAYIHDAHDTSELRNGAYQIWLISPDGSNKRYFRPGDSPSWSPDSRKLCFVSGAQIYSITIAGDSLTQLTDSGANHLPSWSKDGLKIAYESNVDGSYSLWEMNPDGSNKKKIAQSLDEADWSPTNSEIVADGYPPGDPYSSTQLYKVNVITGQTTRLTYDSYTDRSPSWSWDGKTIAYSSYNGIRLINPDGTNSRLLPTLLPWEINSGQLYWICRNPSWSPDGKQIVYNKQYLWIINADGTGNHQITN
jgi:Tol biopolymer transport system component